MLLLNELLNSTHVILFSVCLSTSVLCEGVCTQMTFYLRPLILSVFNASIPHMDGYNNIFMHTILRL